MEKTSKIYVAGHRGLVGSAICRELEKQGYTNIITRTHSELDLIRQADVEEFFEKEKPEYVFLVAAKVGGIMANMQAPADFLYDNIAISSNVIHSAYKNNVEKLLFLGSSCIYPRACPQPIKEEYLLTDILEPTNEGYAIAKIAGLKMCEYYNTQYGANFISAMPCNMYGIGDNFDLEKSHVVAGLIRRFHEAKLSNADEIQVFGTGKARRELMFSEDLSYICVELMNQYSNKDFLNVGTGVDHSIEEIAYMVKELTQFQGEIVFDTTKPDGMPQKLMDVTNMNNLGIHTKTDLKEGLKQTYKWYLDTLK